MRIAEFDVLGNKAELVSAATIKAVQTSFELKELALESLLDICREPTMVLDWYVNYDCDFSCTNLFESLVKSLCKCSVPDAARAEESTSPRDDGKSVASTIGRASGVIVNRPSGGNHELISLNLIALEGILAVIDQVSNFDNLSNLIESEASQETDGGNDQLSQQLKQKKG